MITVISRDLFDYLVLELFSKPLPDTSSYVVTGNVMTGDTAICDLSGKVIVQYIGSTPDNDDGAKAYYSTMNPQDIRVISSR